MASKGVSKILGFVFLGFILMGCGDYAKILKSPDNDLKFKAAKTYYDNTKFDKALPLFEDVLAAWKGQDKAEEVYYYYCFTTIWHGQFTWRQVFILRISPRIIFHQQASSKSAHLCERIANTRWLCQLNWIKVKPMWRCKSCNCL